ARRRDEGLYRPLVPGAGDPALHRQDRHLSRQDMGRIVSTAELIPVITFVGILAVVFGGGAYFYSQLAGIPYQCAEQSEPISQTGKYRIEMTKEACGGIAFSATTFLAIRSEQSNQRTTFFSYAGGCSDPRLKWASDNVL